MQDLTWIRGVGAQEGGGGVRTQAGVRVSGLGLPDPNGERALGQGCTWPLGAGKGVEMTPRGFEKEAHGHPDLSPAGPHQTADLQTIGL